MKRAVLYSPQALILVCLCGSVRSFHNHGAELGHASHRTVIKNKFCKNNNQGLFAYYEDDDMKRLLPETSFGAEAVPEGQRPVNEYLDLIRAPLFGWASEDVGNKGLLTRLVTVYVASFAAVCYPISGATFTQEGYMVQKLAASNVGAMTLVIFLLLRLYTGWGYVGSRLKSKVVEYEETGWYDGDVELKSEPEKQRDMFLYTSNVKPVEDRLKLFSAAAAVFWIVSCVGLNAAVSAKPVFNEYDPKLLEKLQYDDKLAGVAADQSFSRPTYCDSRYYRAVANGGQGCGDN
ncbi:Protein of unknown function (DUF1230) [Fragilaria crotonensis]|nr:Protein of unknown function (DUF1230) [Fragilaria crotonensis]